MNNRFSHIEIALVIGGTAGILMFAVLFDFPLAVRYSSGIYTACGHCLEERL